MPIILSDLLAHCWSICVCCGVRHPEWGCYAPPSLNKTFIPLILKKSKPDHTSDFRPISLCNVVYKLVSKVLANRLKIFLSDIITVNHSALVPGRLITDNVLVAFEMFRFMKNLKQVEGYMALKLDMSKAYDRIEWCFLEATLVKIGLDMRWVNRVMECVRSVTFSVLINDHPTDEISPTRGIRQGDPLSSYLFILGAEVFTHILRRAKEHRGLRGVRVASSAPTVSHVLFAYDSVIFLRASSREVDNVKDVLEVYEKASG